jgi:hypothetical protein
MVGVRLHACAIDFEDMMSLTHLLLATALLPAAAIAQQALPDAADPNAATTAPVYVSAFSDYRAAADTSAAPDAVWRDANAQLVNATGHSGHGSMDMAGTQPHAPASAASAAAATSNAHPSPHADHGSHHH